MSTDEVMKFKADNPDVVSDAKALYEKFKHLSDWKTKVTRNLARIYTDPTGRDQEKTNIMSFINGSLEQLLNIQEPEMSAEDFCQSVRSIIRDTLRKNDVKSHNVESCTTGQTENTTSMTLIEIPIEPIETLNVDAELSCNSSPISKRKQSQAVANVQEKAKRRRRRKKASKQQNNSQEDDDVKILSEYEGEDDDINRLVNFVRNEVAKEHGSDPSRQLLHIFPNQSKCWYNYLKDLWNVPDLSDQFKDELYSAYKRQRLQQGLAWKDFKAKYKDSLIFQRYNKWILKQEWSKQRKLNAPGADHGNKSQVCNWLFQACAIWGKDGFKHRMQQASNIANY